MSRTDRAKIIAFEGIDGSGKGVQFEQLYHILTEEGARVGKMDFPAYDGFFGREIGRMLSGNDSVTASTVDVKSMSLWYAMDRMAAFRSTDLSAYDYVLLNRSSLSNAVYQSARCSAGERKALMEWIMELEFVQMAIPRPDLYVIFDVPTAQSEMNVAKKGHRDYIGERADVYEADRSFLSDVRSCYLEAERLFECAVVLDCMGSDGMRPVQEISAEVRRIIRERVQ